MVRLAPLLALSCSRTFKFVRLLMVLQCIRLAVGNLSFVFPKVVLQLKTVISSFPADSGLFSVCTPCLSELSFTTTLRSSHKELAVELGEVWV